MSSISLKGLNDSVTRSMHNSQGDEFPWQMDDMEIITIIEKVRQELHSMLDNYDEVGSSDKIIEVSQYLDRLLVVYERNKERAI